MSKQLRLPTLLVVADNPSIRFWVKKHLDDQFFIIAAETKLEALNALNARLDFIIVDAAFEECDALEVCKELSQLAKKGLIPILLITGRLKKSFRDKAIKSGVTEFLSDQLDVEELNARIAAGLKTASSRQKTEDFVSGIKLPKHDFANASLKNKFVLGAQGLKLLAAAKEEKTPVALLLMRIDRFSEMDAEIVAPFTEFLRSLLKSKDLLIPSTEGGFIILLSNTKIDEATKMAEQLSKSVQNKQFTTKKGLLRITVSIAISSLEASEKGFNKMLDSAVKSLKAHGATNLIISIDQEKTA